MQCSHSSYIDNSAICTTPFLQERLDPIFYDCSRIPTPPLWISNITLSNINKNFPCFFFNKLLQTTILPRICWDYFAKSSKDVYGNFSSWFCSIFLRYCQIFIFEIDTGHYVISALNFKIFLKFRHF